jgi:hypothetical protein
VLAAIFSNLNYRNTTKLPSSPEIYMLPEVRESLKLVGVKGVIDIIQSQRSPFLKDGVLLRRCRPSLLIQIDVSDQAKE